ncbi:hypothetical protein GW17_00024706 [Ensete ventricosum]|nr:hypothetical protein GW17_00024706 [Ensete ventricosum]RZR87601.1 hypothetical protein BHM03_00015052 [Ensete ventricosum]
MCPSSSFSAAVRATSTAPYTPPPAPPPEPPASRPPPSPSPSMRFQVERWPRVLDKVIWVGSGNLNSAFLGDRSRICLSDAPFSRFRFLRKPVECKESRIGKRPIEVPTNVTITLDGQDLKVKGPLGELSRTYPREVKVERDESGLLKVFKAVETRRANQMHGLFR